ncbi:MFS transporter [Microbacterium sp. STN6]|uniref:MFS transporter n=1 Tax=Microbacterium sp. STN6 TaxID=2995588 RepID=UPI002260B64D|nr:MFS transporter [Microbacterium sp. STN6]MCX7521227.1 MFS transporter [Microbacterium sp. STN6]
MPPSPSLPLWKGRTLALAGILLVAANLRTAVAALSPIIDHVRADIPLSALVLGVLGMLPPVCFAVFGIITPLFTRRMSLELMVLLSLGAIVVGTVLRAASDSLALLLIGSALAFAGMGVGNVLLPPLVKRYFGDRIGLLTGTYATILAVSTLLPPLVAVPVADGAGWRVSIGMWAALAIVATLPWIGVLATRRPVAADSGVVEEAEPRVLSLVWRSPVAWSTAVVFAVSSLNAYAMFAWLPEILQDRAGVSPAAAGALLSLYAAAGIPTGILVPMLALRLRNVGILVYTGVGFFILGYLGLIFWPSTGTIVWALSAGLGPMLFPLCLVLINLRTRTHAGSVALSGFAQGVGYTLGALGPLAVAVLHQLTGGWTVPLIVLIGTALAAALAGSVIARPHLLEDDFRR